MAPRPIITRRPGLRNHSAINTGLQPPGPPPFLEHAQASEMDTTPDHDEKNVVPLAGRPVASAAESDSEREGIEGSKNESLQLPRATITKIINELLPPGTSCPKETRELLMRCCIEFIHLVTGEANDLCETGGKKTISPVHILDALKMLGFGDYCAEAEAAKSDFEEAQKHKRQGREKGKDLLEKTGLSESELLRQQEELFEAARQRYLSSTVTTPVSSNHHTGNAADKTVADLAGDEDDDDEIQSGTKPL